MRGPVWFYPCSALHHWEPQGLCGWCLLSHDLLQCKSTYIKQLDLCLDIFLLHIVPNWFNCPSVITHLPLPQICFEARTPTQPLVLSSP